MWSLYCVTNLVNGKIYIGQTISPTKRWYEHCRKAAKPKMPISFAIKKYGNHNFIFEIIASCKAQEDANELETLLVKQYNSFINDGYGYNATLGGMNAPKTDEWKKKVSKTLTFSLNEFIERANEVHQNKYDYSQVVYVKARSKVKIICFEHGIFEQTPDKHLNRDQGCPNCRSKEGGLKNSKQCGLEFENKAILVHGNSYDYSQVEYIKATLKVAILCKKHNIIFMQTPNNHLNGYGCKICGIESSSNTRRKVT